VARAGVELRRAMSELVGVRFTVTESRTVSIASLFELFESNAAIANAAGLRTAAAARRAYKAAHPKARKKRLDEVARKAERERDSFMRELQRYRKGQRAMGPKYRARLAPLQEREVRRRRSVSSLAELARTMVASGVTILAPYDLLVVVSSDERWRYRLPTVPITFPIDTRFIEAVEANDFERAAVEFFDAWALSYGIGRYVVVTEAEGVSFRIGSTARRTG
jgi:hypothetical protein